MDSLLQDQAPIFTRRSIHLVVSNAHRRHDTATDSSTLLYRVAAAAAALFLAATIC